MAYELSTRTKDGWYIIRRDDMTTTTNGKELSQYTPPRLPYHDNLQERFGVDKTAWHTLVSVIFPTARTAQSVLLALSYCKARNLDIFKRPVHIVPMWNSAARAYVETIWPGIAEPRTTAFRTGQFAGMDQAAFGPTITKTFTGKTEKASRTVEVTFPEWCQITIHRMVQGHRVPFHGPKTYWLETYAKWAGTEVPNDMWAKRPVGQIEKCAEAAALRRAFPEEVGNELTAEEMAGQVIDDGESGAQVHQGPPPPPPPPPQAKKAASNKPEPPPPPPPQETKKAESQRYSGPVSDQEYIDLVEAGRDDGSTIEWTDAQDAVQGESGATEIAERTWLERLNTEFAACENLGAFAKAQTEVMAVQKGKVSKETWSRAMDMAKETYSRVSKAT